MGSIPQNKLKTFFRWIKNPGIRAKLIIGLFGIQILIFTANYFVHTALIDKSINELSYATILILTLIVSGLFSFYIIAFLTQPIKILNEKIKYFIAKKSSSQEFLKTQDEILELESSFEFMSKSISEHKTTLEEKIIERTQDLKNSLQEITHLKFQQDGDYFLTAQLLKPLGGNHAKSKTLNIDYYIQQKKQFLFKKWKEEIGGDLCITKSIQLEGKLYTFVLNADAMGKSIQGAGGILVFGSIINANLDRTLKSSLIQKQSPERWLKNCFIELQDVFETFEDMMYISAVISLIEEETGTMYYINADHPKMVLHRDDRARFISNDNRLNKIGMKFMESRLIIKSFLLKTGDIIFIGSDGRDDIKTGEDEKGYRIINEDDMLFVQYVQNNKGNLESILNSIHTSGDLTDDISLMRIEYKNIQDVVLSKKVSILIAESAKVEKKLKNQMALKLLNEAQQLQPDVPLLFKRKARLLYLENDFKNATLNAKSYFNLKPSDSRFMSFLATCLAKSGEIIEAIEIRERLRLRNPLLAKNLSELSFLYKINGNLDRSILLLKEANQISK